MKVVVRPTPLVGDFHINKKRESLLLALLPSFLTRKTDKQSYYQKLNCFFYSRVPYYASHRGPLRLAVTAISPSAPQPLIPFSSPWFAGSTDCAICHDLLVDEKGSNVSIKSHWRSTMMANAANDPLWMAKVIPEIRRNPALKKLIEKKCATWHTLYPLCRCPGQSGWNFSGTDALP